MLVANSYAYQLHTYRFLSRPRVIADNCVVLSFFRRLPFTVNAVATKVYLRIFIEIYRYRQGAV